MAPGRIVGHEPVGVIDSLGTGRRRLHHRAARHRRCDHAVRAMPSLPGRPPLPVRRQGDGRLALRQYHRRRAGGIPAGAARRGKPHPRTRRPDRRAGADVPRHHEHGFRRRGKRRDQDRRYGRGVRSGPDRPVRNRRGETQGRDPHHRRRRHCGTPGDGQAHGGRHHHQLQGHRPGRRDHAAHGRPRRGRRDRGAWHAADLRELPAGAQARRRAFQPGRVFREIVPARSMRSPPGSATTGS